MIIDKKTFIDNFVYPISVIASNARFECGEVATSLVATPDNSIILYALYESKVSETNEVICLPDLKRFSQLVYNCESTSDGLLNLPISNNKITYKSKSFKFDYYLLDSTYITKVPISIEKLNNLTYDTVFSTSGENILNILKMSSITSDTDKVYFYTAPDGVYIDLDDKQRANITNLSVRIADAYAGDALLDPSPISLDNLRLISLNKTDEVIISINHKMKVFSLCIKHSPVTLKYVISGLVK